MAALAAYLAIRGNQPGPFFQFRDGRPLSRERFVIKVREALTEAGLEASKFAGHSFQIGAATTAAARGVEDSLIKTLGRWELCLPVICAYTEGETSGTVYCAVKARLTLKYRC